MKRAEPKGVKFFYFILIFVVSILGNSKSWADPEEELSIQMKRTFSDAQVVGTLKKNLFKQEAYQDTYPVQVPYEAEETYYEDVPYQDQETYYVDVPYQEQETYYERVPYQEQETYYEKVPYTERESYQDYEEYWDYERQCRTEYENVCRRENVCRTEYDRQCRTERVCRSEPGENQCKMVEECGTNAHGQRICKERKVCERGPSREVCNNEQKCDSTPRQVCSEENKCHQVPKEKCENERVRKTRSVTKWRDVTKYRDELRTRTVTKYREEARTRTVTKYRSEARTRTVTKYRKEERTRTVTRYRTEYKCCVTRYREVFDRQENIEVVLLFPKNSDLLNTETEVFDVTLTQGSPKPQVELKMNQTIYGYKILKQEARGQRIEIELGLTPKYTTQELGEKSVSLLKMVLDLDGFQVNFLDQGLRSRVETKYRVQIKNKTTQEVVLDQVAMGVLDKKNVKIILPKSLELENDYDLSLQVYRTGVVLNGEVNFLTKATYSFDRLNSKDYGPQTLKDLTIQESNEGLVFSWQDLGLDQRFETKYGVKVFKGKNKELIFEKEFFSKEGKKVQVQKDLVTENEEYHFQLQVQRSGRILDQDVQFLANKVYQRSLDKSLFEGEDKIQGFTLGGEGIDGFVEFKDLSPLHLAVVTQYELTLWGPGGFLGQQKKMFLTKTLTRSAQVKNPTHWNLVKDLGLSEAEAKKYLRSGFRIDLQLVVKRQSALFLGEKEIKITKTKSQKVEGTDSESPWGNE